MSVIFAWEVPSHLWQILHYYCKTLAGSPSSQITSYWTCQSKIVSFGCQAVQCINSQSCFNKIFLIAAKLEIPEEGQEEVAGTLINLYKLFMDKDATMVEINPFAEDAQGGK